MTTFSLFPNEIKQEIGTYFSSRDVMSLCRVEKAVSDICKDERFWRTLITTKFPDFVDDPRYLDHPKDLLSYLEQHVYRITLTLPNKKPLCFTSDDKNVIAITIMIAFTNCCRTQTEKIYLVNELKIIKPSGVYTPTEEPLTDSEVNIITTNYTNSFEFVDYYGIGRRFVTYYPKHLEQYREMCYKSMLYIPTDPKIKKYALNLLEYLEATDVYTSP